MKLVSENLVLKYKDGERERTILDNVSITLDNKKPNIIIGPSGSGKSSLLYLFSSLRQPTSGTIYFNNIDLTKTKSLEQIRYEHFGFVFQQHFLIPYLSVLENVCLAKKDKNIKKDALEMLARLEIEDLQSKKPYQLSGGERQRVSISRALVKRPSIIFADEPTASLDKDNAVKIFSLLKEISKSSLVIIATHDTSLLSGNERLLKIENSKIIEI